MMGQINHLLTQNTLNLSSKPPLLKPCFNPNTHVVFRAISQPSKLALHKPISTSSISLFSPLIYAHQPNYRYGSSLFCKFKDSDSMSQLELGKRDEKQKPEKMVTGIYWIILLNIGIYVADHIFQLRGIRMLYLYHNWPAWYQFVTAAFCHANWNHLSSNLFFLYIFGKLVEEEEGSFGVWLSYIVTGVGANLVSWLLLPRNAVSVGASGAVFGLFAISVLVKMSYDWRKILEVLILGQFVIERVMEAAQASTTGLSNGFIGASTLQSVNHLAHLSGALVGVLLVWLLSRIPSGSSEK